MKKAAPKPAGSDPATPEVEHELRWARTYWLKIKDRIKGREIHGVEWFLVQHAHTVLAEAVRRVDEWNATEEGKRTPVPEETLAELLNADEFCAPPPPMLPVDEYGTLAFKQVTIEEIMKSNAEDSGQLPLLPPQQNKRNEDEEKPAAKPRLSKEAISKAVRGFLKDECALNNWQKHRWILLQNLCQLRWQRFCRLCEKQQRSAAKRT